MLLPFLAGNFIDSVVTLKNMQIVLKIAFLYLVLSILNLFIGFIVSRLVTKLRTSITYDLNKDIIENFKNQSLKYIEKFDLSELNQRIIYDVNCYVGFIINLVSTLIINIIKLVLSSIIVFYINYNLFLLIILLELVFILWYTFFKKKVYDSQKQLTNTSNQLYSRTFEQLTTIRLVKLFNLWSYFRKRLDKTFSNYYEVVKKNQIITFLFTSSESIVTLFGQVFLFLLGGNEIIKGKLTIGMYSIISNYFNIIIDSSKYFSGLSKQYQEMKVSLDRLLELNKSNFIEKENYVDIGPIENIRLQHLNFSYEIDPIIKDFSYNFVKGKIYCITGYNGAGKSTLLDLIMGLYQDEYTGDIIFNNINITDLNMRQIIGEYFSILSQKSIFLFGSIRENIKLNKNISDEEINKILYEFNFYSDLKDLSLDTIINFTCNNFSGGELQKIALCRMLLYKNCVHILDEPTTYLDYKSKKNLLNYLEEIKKNSIVIIVSHDNEIINNADYIINLD